MTGAPDERAIAEVAAGIFPGFDTRLVTRVAQGVSTWVYRLQHRGDTYYLRILPEEDASFGSEAHVHTLLLNMGARVPEVVHFEHMNDIVRRSIMVTTEIPGFHVGHLADRKSLNEVLVDAGRDLAIVNSILVAGFGWIKHNLSQHDPLEGEFLSFREFTEELVESNLKVISDRLLCTEEVVAIERIINRYDPWLDVDEAVLAHGDFDVTHIFQMDGRYAGIIDFGEIRGGDLFYDLGHFDFHDGETIGESVLPYLLDGYQQMVPLPVDYEERIGFSSLLIGIRWLARSVEKFPDQDFSNNHAIWAIRRNIELLN